MVKSGWGCDEKDEDIILEFNRFVKNSNGNILIKFKGRKRKRVN